MCWNLVLIICVVDKQVMSQLIVLLSIDHPHLLYILLVKLRVNSPQKRCFLTLLTLLGV